MKVDNYDSSEDVRALNGCEWHIFLAEISTKQKSIEEVYASISSRISPGQGTAFS